MTCALTITRDDQLTVELTDPSIPVIVTAMHHELLRTKTEVTRVTVTDSTTPYTLVDPSGSSISSSRTRVQGFRYTSRLLVVRTL